MRLREITFRLMNVTPERNIFISQGITISVIRHISPMSRNISCFCDANISGQLNQLQCWDRKCWAVIVYFRGGDGGGWQGLYKMGCSACSCREDENVFLPHAAKNS